MSGQQAHPSRHGGVLQDFEFWRTSQKVFWTCFAFSQKYPRSFGIFLNEKDSLPREATPRAASEVLAAKAHYSAMRALEIVDIDLWRILLRSVAPYARPLTQLWLTLDSSTGGGLCPCQVEGSPIDSHRRPNRSILDQARCSISTLWPVASCTQKRMAVSDHLGSSENLKLYTKQLKNLGDGMSLPAGPCK